MHGGIEDDGVVVQGTFGHLQWFGCGLELAQLEAKRNDGFIMDEDYYD